MPESASTWCGLSEVPSARCGSSSESRRSSPSMSENSRRHCVDGCSCARLDLRHRGVERPPPRRARGERVGDLLAGVHERLAREALSASERLRIGNGSGRQRPQKWAQPCWLGSIVRRSAEWNRPMQRGPPPAAVRAVARRRSGGPPCRPPANQSLAHPSASANLLVMRRTAWIARHDRPRRRARHRPDPGRHRRARVDPGGEHVLARQRPPGPRGLAAATRRAPRPRERDHARRRRRVRRASWRSSRAIRWSSTRGRRGAVRASSSSRSSSACRPSWARRSRFLGLNVSDNRQDAEAYLKKTPVPYPHLEDKDSRIVQEAGARGGLPTTIYYDKDGKREFIHQGGYTDDADLVEDIRKYAG